MPAFTAAGGDKPLIGIKTPTSHPYLCYSRNGDGTLESLLGIDADQYYQRQQYPEYFELTHWACMVPVSAVDRIKHRPQHSQCFHISFRPNHFVIIELT